jgi:hypothetical protein
VHSCGTEETRRRHFAENCLALNEETPANRRAEKIHFHGLLFILLRSDMMRRPTLPLKEREQPLTGCRLPWLEACLDLSIP